MQTAPHNGDDERVSPAPVGRYELLDSEAERSARERLFDDVLAAVELVLVADGAAFWREEVDHSLVLTASRSMPQHVLDAFDRHVATPLQSIMQRWPDSPLVAVPLNDPTNPIAEEIRQLAEDQEIVGLAGIPCRVMGEMLGMLVVIHRRPHPWTVRDLGLATGLAGQLATALQNAGLFASVRSLANRLAAIHELSLRLNQLRDVGAIDEAIVSEVGRLVDCDTVRVYRLNPEDKAFRPVAASGQFVGIQSPPLQALSAGHGETLPAWVAKRNEPLIIADASVERRSIVRSTFGPESLLLVPMSYGDDVQGVLVVSKEGVGKYGREDEQALSIFGRYAAQALVNAHNRKQLEMQHALLEQQVAAERQLLDLSEQLVSTLDPRRVLEQIADTIGTVVKYDRLTLYRVDSESGGIEAVISRADSGEATLAPTNSSADEGLTGWVIGRGDAVCANDVDEEVLAAGPDTADGLLALQPSGSAESGRPARDSSFARSIIVVPLRVQGQVIGSLNLTRVGGSEVNFTEHEFELSKLFAGQASIALQNAEAHVTVASRADLDALTGLRNHGTFQRDLTALIEVGDPFSILMMDLDSFKAFNDTYGHPAGDALLQTVAKAIVTATRQNDQAYRYGGDEFALLLIGASRSHAEEVAARVRSAVRDTVRGSAVGGFGAHVTASVGAAHWPADGRSKAALVEAADAALYRSKRGRSTESDTTSLTPESREHDAPPSLLDAARDLLATTTVEDVATVLARHAAALLGAGDSFVALAEDPAEVDRPASPPVGAPIRPLKPVMRQMAATGIFVTRPQILRRGTAGGVWGRVWQSGLTQLDDDGAERRIGFALKVDGRIAGVVGASAPASATVLRDRSHAATLLADLASVALQRAVTEARRNSGR
jgi:diguanylate cyclase (GGDEF)-like protein